MTDLTQLRSLAAHYLAHRAPEVLPRLRFGQLTASPAPVPMLYEPTICLVLSGRKHVEAGTDRFDYAEGQCLVTAVDMPVMAGVSVNEDTGNYMAMGLDLNPQAMADLAFEMGLDGDVEVASNFCVVNTDTSLLDTWRRLCELLDHPQDIAILAPLIEKELLFRLLQGPQGRMLVKMVSSNRHVQRIRDTASWIRLNYAKSFHVSDLAENANMSPTAFHRHFKQIMSMSPLQYQKQVRLYEARSSLMAHGGDTASVAFAVGYESTSQFSREYKRLFGYPPSRSPSQPASKDLHSR